MRASVLWVSAIDVVENGSIPSWRNNRTASRSEDGSNPCFEANFRAKRNCCPDKFSCLMASISLRAAAFTALADFATSGFLSFALAMVSFNAFIAYLLAGL